MNESSDRITLADGEGGRKTRQLIRERILKRLGNEQLNALGDAAHLEHPHDRLAITTDGYVVTPRFFPGGDIGQLAVHGSINDLAVSGAEASHLALALIVEEGLPIDEFDRVLASIAQACEVAGVQVVAGDTKVVPRGAVDGLFITTTAVGFVRDDAPPGPYALQVGDEILVSGPIGRHGVAILAAREHLGFEPAPESDSAPLHRAIQGLLERAGEGVRAIRDATRGGVAAVLHEWAEASGMKLQADEDRLPITPEVRGVCELLGLDPLHCANEGVMVIAVAEASAPSALEALRAHPESSQATCIGRVVERGLSPVTVRGRLGVERPLDDPPGAQLPRIC